MGSKHLLAAAVALMFGAAASAQPLPTAKSGAVPAPAAAAAPPADAAPPLAEAAEAVPQASAAARAEISPWPRIEQVRRGNRVAEVRVTSPSGQRRYTMENREGREPLSTQELSSGLSTPNFFRLEF